MPIAPPRWYTVGLRHRRTGNRTVVTLRAYTATEAAAQAAMGITERLLVNGKTEPAQAVSDVHPAYTNEVAAVIYGMRVRQDAGYLDALRELGWVSVETRDGYAYPILIEPTEPVDIGSQPRH